MLLVHHAVTDVEYNTIAMVVCFVLHNVLNCFLTQADVV